ncbi:uncharacterized protein LOC110100344 [Dendrobium catenatum]|uniref:FAF domain-containing protein n=1 Tax=Dendrobium catenatum TaxID=906689 RepID=A0A2I0XGX8_9ASPA|nr:uncharacterized protein LOC110100344 [Dendrobium catenatum]PKU87165.1 hypothetical protein MA16_Dca006574 [Dendrobium catenatum]
MADDSYSPWGQHLPSTSSVSSFEIFGEHCHSPSSTTSPPPPPPTHHQSIASMPEPHNTPAFKIIDELCHAEKSDFYPNSDANMPSKSTCERSSFEEVGEYRRSNSDVGQRIAASGNGDGDGVGQVEFPPPITTIGSGGKPRVYFKSFRKDGRFVLREIRIPTQRCLQSKREDGRLTMQVLGPRDEEEEMMKGDREDN